MAFIGTTKTLTFYQGSISVAAGFSGDKDVTIASVVPTKSIPIPAQTVPILSQVAGFLGYGSGVGTSQLQWSYVQIPSATVFRFTGVTNTDSSSHNISYAFWVVEYR